MVHLDSQRGLPYFRALLSRAVGGNRATGVEYAISQYGSRVAEITRAAVAAGGVANDWGAVLATPEQQEFFAAVERASVVGRLGLKQVALDVRTILMSARPTGYFVGAGQPKPLTKMDLSGDVLKPFKVASIFVLTRESIRAGNPRVEAGLRDELIRVLGETIDAAFLDAENAGVADEVPAAVTYGLTPLASTGVPDADIAALVAAFEGNLDAAVFVSDPQTATELALFRDAGGASMFPDAGPKGGSILNMPLLTSRSSPRDTGGGQIALVDGGGIAYGGGGVKSVSSEQATLEMEDEPDGPSQQVSMYQTNSVAFLSEIVCNWKVVRPGSVAVVTNVDYAVQS